MAESPSDSVDNVDKERQTAKAWALGIATYTIEMSATSLYTLVAAPDVFNITSVEGLKRLGMVALVGALTGVFLYLKLYPLPGVKTKN